MIKRVKKEIKHKWNKFKWKMMRFFHIGYLKLLWIPRPVKYAISIVLIGVGIVLLTTPIPWILFIFMGLWILYPTIQYKYIWKYFKPRTIRRIEKKHSVNIKNILKQKSALH